MTRLDGNQPAAGQEDHTRRVRSICTSLPGVGEKLSHGEPTFFVKKKVFAMLSTNHHNDGHVAVVLPVPPGHQEMLISTLPATYYRPPYVGVRGWAGIELGSISDEDLAVHLHEARELILASTRRPTRRPASSGT